jgi:leucyl aminopeptidase
MQMTQSAYRTLNSNNTSKNKKIMSAKFIIKSFLLATALTATSAAFGLSATKHTHQHLVNNTLPKPVIADIAILQKAGVELLTTDQELGLGYGILTNQQEIRLNELAHAEGKCGGFEMLPFGAIDGNHPLISDVFGQLREQNAKNRRFHPTTESFNEVENKPEIANALEEVNTENMRATVEFLASFPNRAYRDDQPNRAVDALKARLEELTKGSSLPITVESVVHQRIQQHSLKVRIQGAKRPNEIIILGGHLDSINNRGGDAPGADDNASGSANLVEALRILLSKSQPERTIEFFWYAGEEGGLIGSAEIAQSYKTQGAKVVAVLQLDMTLFPGAGAMTLGSMTDYTSSWLRSYLETINGLYIKAGITPDRCGYGCSDHASWHRQGYPTLMPFESTMGGRNRAIHTDGDILDSRLNFEHSAIFTKIAVVMAMDLGNSTLTEPK